MRAIILMLCLLCTLPARAQMGCVEPPLTGHGAEGSAEYAVAIVQDAQINGSPMSANDAVSVWTDAGKCVGKKHPESIPFAIPIWAKGDYSDGAEQGERLSYRVYDDASNRVLSDVNVTMPAVADVPECAGAPCVQSTQFTADVVYVISSLNATRPPGVPLPDSIETNAVWSRFGEGSYAPVITIPDEFYPDAQGVCFYVRDELIRCDETGPREATPSKQYEVYPAQNLGAGDEVVAVWFDQAGVKRWNRLTIYCQGVECDTEEIVRDIVIAVGDTVEYVQESSENPNVLIRYRVYTTYADTLETGSNFDMFFTAEGSGYFRVWTDDSTRAQPVSQHTTEREAAERAILEQKACSYSCGVWYDHAQYKVRVDAVRRD